VRVPQQGRRLFILSLFAAMALIEALALRPLHASSPRFFLTATQTDFLKGDVENLAIDTHGRLTLGPATETIFDASTPFLWSLLATPDGNLFLGSGNEGKVFRVDAQGRGSLFFDSAELEVHALASAPNGGLYVGTSPDGRVYKVDRNGTGTSFFSSDDKYIWALTVDAGGNVFAGTGDKGLIYKITPEGTATTFCKTNATHAMALAFDQAGNLFVGTGTPGRVLRVDPDGRAFVLLDSPFQEIRALRFDDKGALYVAAVNGRSASGGAPVTGGDRIDTTPAEPRAPVASVSAEISSFSIADAGATIGTAVTPREDRRLQKGAVYRIAPDGVWDQLWESLEDSPYDLTFDRNGALLIGTGNTGKLYRLEGEPLQPTLMVRAPAQQVTAFYHDARGRLSYATANPGKLFRLAADRTATGTYESEVRDAQMVAAWGALSWRGTTPVGGRIELSTRSGNTDTPDDTWSVWSGAYTDAEGSPVTSPKARYLQWRAVLSGKGESPVLTSVTAAYLQRNLRPQVHSISVHEPGIVFQKPFTTGEPDLAGFEDQTTPERRLASAAASQASSGSALGRRAYQKGLQTLIWKADDENGDELVHDVLYRQEGETSWKTLRRSLAESILVWDTTTVPNGTYFVKIVASDSPSNAAGSALVGEIESSAFQIDNVPPTIAIGTVRVDRGRTIIPLDVKDDHSPVQRVEASQDGQGWHSVFPVDGIADSRAEHYEVVVDGELGERGLTVRASDSMNNVATTHVDAPRRR
jgi:hypothetical protein